MKKDIKYFLYTKKLGKIRTILLLKKINLNKLEDHMWGVPIFIIQMIKSTPHVHVMVMVMVMITQVYKNDHSTIRTQPLLHCLQLQSLAIGNNGNLIKKKTTTKPWGLINNYSLKDKGVINKLINQWLGREEDKIHMLFSNSNPLEPI